MHKHNFGPTLKLQSAVVNVNIRSRSLKSKYVFLSPNNVPIGFGAENPIGSEDRAQKRLNLQFFFNDDDL